MLFLNLTLHPTFEHNFEQYFQFKPVVKKRAIYIISKGFLHVLTCSLCNLTCVILFKTKVNLASY